MRTEEGPSSGSVWAAQAITGLYGGAQAPVVVLGDPNQQDLQACWELGAAMAAGVIVPAG